MYIFIIIHNRIKSKENCKNASILLNIYSGKDFDLSGRSLYNKKK